ncbi:MAG: hypothetical protein A3D24_01355 [Candidatus Blackburnbacteria bacterium RIFCSPHIGHO2_02_FULL_39_13]|uniref:Uncharacterized protein n=1 Tax=Candidatus Blackburnbacteria bacterium RIFCSPLOWO2_01_FULL_40_20 TaxID=1797519 RepID=A0A1G1VFC7_9BACT|nr:MAG: hypothetical protein UT38_C0006G0013 [Microgenomates group bacterium GW2011_GWA2_39_19]OGY06776.1 MAG: hypothetical protein A2694_00460 [Candidatus Blackburnbacteria bacterium RIFCSPHIGHO2_01_FULL_40_17]OGY09791.1 MAG: hypothetical protein A3D24_01355 [Candidatus Blackburnbacteria bacterium RIFCSPHIGHO2_02_FULL_39_13]OGY14071.1 MAG: hypothetical protein A3A77_03800 [Candidatus Blackburnbacteria bacterium RIFCSPLOWO2_01_FULL_40_20]HBL52273.1 hypothetical protein [Candidatus Blackburnbact
MGLVKPPWTDNDFFENCPFNYCDHFGNRKRLGLLCKICEETKYLDEERMDFSYIEEIVKPNLVKLRYRGSEEAWERVIKERTIEDIAEGPLLLEYYAYSLSRYYAALVRLMIRTLSIVPRGVDLDLMEKALDAFTHAEHCIPAKIRRAYLSRERDKRALVKCFDDKTSALFAYMAAERNSRAFQALANHEPLHTIRERNLRLVKLSLTVCEVIRREFIGENLKYEEFGCEEYDQCFEKYAKNTVKIAKNQSEA